MTPDPTASPAHPVETLSLAERLGRVAYRNQGRSEAEPHIVVDTAICNSVCPHKCTTYVCPANCYTLDEMQQVHFQFEDCIECGTTFGDTPGDCVTELPYISIAAEMIRGFMELGEVLQLVGANAQRPDVTAEGAAMVSEARELRRDFEQRMAASKLVDANGTTCQPQR